MGETIEEDIISGLPEDLLVSILMFVPIKNAITTMILSKRWRFIWTMMPKLDYNDNYDDDDNDDTMMSIFDYNKEIKKSRKSVWWLLDKSMQLYKAHVLRTLLIKLDSQSLRYADVGKSIAKAVDRGLVKLELDLLLPYVVYPTRLPKTLYLCESLKTLILSHKIFVDVPSTACLPSLTTLGLNSVVYKNEDSLINLLASCPFLESLSVKRKNYDNVRKFTVKSPCLLDLWYANDESSNDNGKYCLVIDTPELTKFDFSDHLGETCSMIKNPSCIEQVSIRSLVGWSLLDTDKFLRSFSTVLSLVLNLSEEMVMCCGNIEFPRLIDCTIFPCDIDWTDSLVSFLQNTPKLKFLTVNYVCTGSPSIASMSWRESSYNPECLSSSLEKFKLVDFLGGQEEVELVEYFLTNAKCLKTATIFSMRFPSDDEDTMITVMEKYLRTIPIVSKTCKLLFKHF